MSSLKIKKLSNKRVNTFERNHDKFYLVITKYNISKVFSVYKIYSFFPSSFIEYYLFLKRKPSNSVCVYVSMCLCLVNSSMF